MCQLYSLGALLFVSPIYPCNQFPFLDLLAKYLNRIEWNVSEADILPFNALHSIHGVHL